MIYKETNTGYFSHNGKNFDLNKIFKIVHNKNTRLMHINKLKWILKHTKVQKYRVKNANLAFPIIITKENNRYIVVDGVHRLQKAVNLKLKKILVKYITDKELKSAKLLKEN